MRVVEKYWLQIMQAVAIAICIGLAVMAALDESAMTTLLLASLCGGGICAAWIFHTSAVGKKTS
jgi:hypothetical protein